MKKSTIQPVKRKEKSKKAKADDQPKIVSTGYRMKELTPEELNAAPSLVYEIYLTMKAGQPVEPNDLKTAIRQYGGKYFIAPKSKYAKKAKPKTKSEEIRSQLRRS
tara:strand:+ start:3158 stop:3475 length:318 start_codon:yes stop_codon:yes gene_type:complete